MRAKTLTVLFLVLVFSLSVLGLILPDRTFSENENRYLESFPTFSIKSLFDGDFTADFETYITDQFPLRDRWIAMKTAVERLTGKREAGGVYFGSNGALIEKFDKLDEEQFTTNIGYLQAYSARLQEKYGLTPRIMLVPTASAIYKDALPRFAPEVDQAALIQRLCDAGLSVVDVTNALTAHRDEYIYYRTDHHWTSLGAYYAYAAYREMLGDSAASYDSYTSEVMSNEFYGTLFSKVGAKDILADTLTACYPELPIHVSYNLGQSESDSYYEPSYLDTKDKYSVYLNANQSLSVISGGVDNGRHLLVFKDSYANTFLQFAVNDYETIHVIDLRYFAMSVDAYLESVAQSGEAITDVLVLYNTKNFSSDRNLFWLK